MISSLSMKATIVRFARRSIAYAVDRILIFLVIRPEAFARVWFGTLTDQWAATLDFLSILLTAVYVIGCHWRWGRTAGKQFMGLRVATLDGISPPSFRASLVRFSPFLVIGMVLFVIDWFILPHGDIGGIITIGQEKIGLWQLIPLIWLVLEMGVALFTGGYRSLHDQFGGTVVTDESAKRKSS